ncbi:MAG: dipicolinate synthase subunit B [Firmicutes bacterium]|nr:dipicolinate synthase subunit B [Bacillota bacterium]
MDLKGLRIGFAVTSSFCTLEMVMPEVANLVEKGAEVLPIMSENAQTIDTRFGKAEDFRLQLEEITGNKIIDNIFTAEPIGPQKMFDILIVAPCTGNTLGKIANGITDTCVTLAVKAHLRNQKPVVIAISTNDGLGLNAKNLGVLLNTRNVYFVPFRQDNPIKKENSLVAKMDLIIPATEKALDGKQYQPMILGTNE